MHERRFLGYINAAATLLSLACGLILARDTFALPGQPMASSYTLVIEPFAKHAGLNAMDLTHANDASGRLFVSTQSGQVFAYSADGQSLGTFLDLAQADPAFSFDPDRRVPFKGLMYIAFHPDYAKADTPGFGKFYTGYAVKQASSPADFQDKSLGTLGDREQHFVINLWQVDSNNPDRIDPGSARRVILFAFHGYEQNPHGLGQIKFNPFAKPGDADYGKLYIAMGDGEHGNYDSTHDLSHLQRPDNPFGKILRIDPLGDGEKPYTIPQDNPFKIETASGEQATAVYAMGLRDAQWFAFAEDLEGQSVLLAADIGHLLVEEINLIRPGGNYGWPRYEGLLDFRTEVATLGSPRPPIVQYGHAIPSHPGQPPKGGMTAIMGGLVVSDPEDPSFQGQILFTDLPRGAFMHANYQHALSVEQTGKQSTPYLMNVRLGDQVGSFAELINAERGDARFGTDEAGRVYIVSKQTDQIFKTKLIYTGKPVRSEPRVSQGLSASGIQGLTIVIGGVAVLLLAMLIAVVFIARRRPA